MDPLEKNLQVPGTESNENTSTPKAAVKLWESIRHFKPSEFDDKTEPGSGLKMNIEFVRLLDQLREKCGFPLQINSGYRTQAHNLEVGGVRDSAHTKGCACDIRAGSGIERFLIVESALALGFRRIGVGKSLVHLDMDFDLPQKVLWVYTDK